MWSVVTVWCDRVTVTDCDHRTPLSASHQPLATNQPERDRPHYLEQIINYINHPLHSTLSVHCHDFKGFSRHQLISWTEGLLEHVSERDSNDEKFTSNLWIFLYLLQRVHYNGKDGWSHHTTATVTVLLSSELFFAINIVVILNGSSQSART